MGQLDERYMQPALSGDGIAEEESTVQPDADGAEDAEFEHVEM